MPRTLPTVAASMRTNSLDSFEPTALKASLPNPSVIQSGQLPSLPVDGDPFARTALVKDALIDACGSLKSASISMGMDQSQLSRELQTDGPKVGKLLALEPSERMKVIDRLHATYGSHAEDPKVRLRQEIRALRQHADQIAELIEREIA